MPEPLALLAYQSWRDLDQATAGLTVAEALEQRDGQSAIAWTVGHVSQQIDSWLNVRIQGLAPHPGVSGPRFRTGATGEAEDWPALQAAVAEVRARARRYLDADPPPSLDLRVPYDGNVRYLRETGLTLRHALMAIAAHHFLHAGEIATLRSLRGHVIPEGGIDWGRAFA